MIYFTSDTHFGHKNIIKYCNRPFDIDKVWEMDDALINNWNARVQPEDTIYHLGDVCFKNADAFQNYMKRLNGHKHLIWGNHDSNQVRQSPLWESSQPQLELTIDKQYVVLYHYGQRVWNHSHHGAIQLYGHSHGSLPGSSQSLDVGSDCWDYTPCTLEEILRRMKTLSPYKQADKHEAM